MQRYVRIFGTPITLLVLLAVLFLGARWGYRNVVAPAPPAPLVPCTQQSVGKALRTSQVQLEVTNGGNVVGLASSVATQLRGVGFVVTRTGNAANPATTTQIIGAAVGNPEMKLVAGYFPGAKLVADARPDHSVTVVVVKAATGFTAKAPSSIPVNTPTVCLPAPIATPSA